MGNVEMGGGHEELEKPDAAADPIANQDTSNGASSLLWPHLHTLSVPACTTTAHDQVRARS